MNEYSTNTDGLVFKRRERQPRASSDRFFLVFLVAVIKSNDYPKSTPTHPQRIPIEFTKNSEIITLQPCIPKEFTKNSQKIPKEFLKNSHRIPKEFSNNF